MSFQSSITCPVCGSPIYIDSQLLLSGASFRCTNAECNASISLTEADKSTVDHAFTEFEKLKDQTKKNAQNNSDQ